MNHFEHIQKTFTLEQMPANVRAGRYFARRPFFRRYHRWPVGSALFSAEGRFSYRRNGTAQTVKFNGRNLQFHALYDSEYRHGYELETALLIATLCQGNAPFFDIGSNWGYFSLLTASLPDFNGPIYAFEPNPRSFADLSDLIKQAGLAGRVTACQIGVGRTACEMTLAETDEFNTGWSRLTSGNKGQKIPVKPLDALDYGQPGTIKIDAEGMELEILAGATRTLDRAKPFLVLENALDFENPKKTHETINYLAENDYRVFLPVLIFSVNGGTVLATYGRDYVSLVERGGQPRLGVVEVSATRRFLLGPLLNLLGAHATRVEELWKLGITDLGKI